MSRMRSVLALLLAALILMPLTGCADNSLSEEEEKTRIKVIVKKRDYDYWAVVQMGAEAAGREFGVEVDFDGPPTEGDIEGQIRMVENAIEQKFDALVLAASDYVALAPVAEEARDAGMPVVIIDSNIKSDKMNSFVGTDNVGAGQKLGESLLDIVGPDCDIVVMSFVKGAATADQREEGFFEKIDGEKGINVLETLYCKSEEDYASDLARDAVERYPELDAIVCLNAYGTVGVARAISRMGKAGRISIIGFDSTPQEVSYMEEGAIQSLVVQNPFNMGYLGVKYALDVLNGDKVPKSVDTGSTVIDRENMYLPENQKLVFPFTD